MARNARGAVAGLPGPLRETLAWAAALPPNPLPLAQLAALRGVAPRTLREHLARLEERGLLRREYAGQAGLMLQVVDSSVPVDPPEVGEQPAREDADRRGRALALLMEAGVYQRTARELVQLPWVEPELVRAWVQALRCKRAVRSVPAVLVHTLRNPARCLPPPHQRSRSPGVDRGGRGERNAGGSPEEPCTAPQGATVKAWPAGDDGRVAYWRVQLAEPAAEPEAPDEDDEAAGELLASLWEQAREAMAVRVSAEMDRLWLEPAWPLCYSDGVLVVAVPTPLAAEWLNGAVSRSILEAIQRSSGTRLALRFVPAGLNRHR